MSNLIIVKSKCDYYKTINKLNNINIMIYDISYKDDYIYLKMNKKDLSKLKKYLPSYKFIKEKELGFLFIKNMIKKYNYYFISLLIGIIFLFLLSNIMVKVEVIHSSKRIRNLLYDALDEEGIRRLTFKKNYRKLSKIKEKILKKYPDDLEWIEIEVHGMKYVIRVEQRIITNPKKEKPSCDLIAKKSGIVTDIITHKGEALVTRGNYVLEGDTLIRGNIMFNDEIKQTVCAKGSIKAEVWYTVNVSMPLNYTKKHKTGNKRHNIVYEKGLKKKSIIPNYYKNYISHDKKIVSFFNTTIYYRTIEKIELIKKKYNEKEALNKAIDIALEKININKKDEDRIITQKVLKKELNDSTINLEIFFAIEEEIGKEIINSNEVE